MKLHFALALCAICASSVSAQPAKRIVIRVGAITSSQDCTIYEGIKASSKTSVSGVASGYANAYGAGGYSGFSASNSSKIETYFVKDCVSHFEGIRTALQSALASSGSVAIASGGYVLSGRVENVAPIASGYEEQAINGNSYGSVSNDLLVTMSVNVADKSGRIVFGAVVVTRMETDSVGDARGTVSVRQSSGEGLYGLLQREVALAVARKVAFHFNPLVVSQGGGRKIQLNYGSPLLEVGSMLSATAPDGSSAVRYRVTSVSDGAALALQIDDSVSTDIVAGSRATVFERGDNAENESQDEKVVLP